MDLFRPASILRELVRTSADAYGFTVEAIEGGTLVSVSDGEARDWFVLRDCGHVSTLYTDRVRAKRSICHICEEEQLSDMSAQHVLNRLNHMRILLKSQRVG